MPIMQKALSQDGNPAAFCGEVDQGYEHVKTRLHCSDKCLHVTNCKGILFKRATNSSEQCRIVTSDSSKRLLTPHLDRAEAYFVKPNSAGACDDLGIGVPTPAGWHSACPTLYFPLDSATEGTPGGTNWPVIDFVPGQVGNAFHLPNGGATVAHFDLGEYPETNYCFPDPERCNEGITVAMWINILGTTGIAHY